MEKRNPLITLSGSTDKCLKKVPVPGSQLIKEGCRVKGCASHRGEQRAHVDPEPQLRPRLRAARGFCPASSPRDCALAVQHPSLGLWESGSLLAAVPTRLTGGGGVLGKASGLFPETPHNSPTRMCCAVCIFSLALLACHAHLVGAENKAQNTSCL